MRNTNWSITKAEFKVILDGPKPRLSRHPRQQRKLLHALHSSNPQEREEAQRIRDRFGKGGAIRQPRKDSKVSALISAAKLLGRPFRAMDLAKQIENPLPPTPQERKSLCGSISGILNGYPDHFEKVGAGVYQLKDTLTPGTTVPFCPNAIILRAFVQKALKQGPQHFNQLVTQFCSEYPTATSIRDPRMLLRDHLKTNQSCEEVSTLTYALRKHGTVRKPVAERVDDLSEAPSKQTARQLIVDGFNASQLKGSEVTFLSLAGPRFPTEQMLVDSGHYKHITCISAEKEPPIYQEAVKSAKQLNTQTKCGRYVALSGRIHDIFQQGTSIREHVKVTEGIDGIWLDFMGRLTHETLGTIKAIVHASEQIWTPTWIRGAKGFLAITVADNGRQMEMTEALDGVASFYSLQTHPDKDVHKLNQLSTYLNHEGVGAGSHFVPTHYVRYKTGKTGILMGLWQCHLGVQFPQGLIRSDIQAI